MPETAEVEGYDPAEWGTVWRRYEEIDAMAHADGSPLSRAERDALKREALSGGAALSEAPWKKVERDTRVDIEWVDSPGYARLVDEAFGGETPADALKDIRRMLKARSGHLYEELYVYDVDTGERLGMARDQRSERSVSPTAEMKRVMRKAVSKGHRIATLHNHPGSSIPSLSDIEALKAERVSFGVIAAHDGTLFRYSVTGEPIEGYTLTDRNIQAAYYKRINSRKSASETADIVEREYGVRIEHLVEGQ